MIRDHNIDYIRARRFIAPLEFNALITPSVSGGTTGLDEGELLQNPTAGTKTAPDISQLEVGTLNFVGLKFAAAGNILQGVIQCPNDLDPKFSVGFRVNFTNNNASAGTVTWILLLKMIKKDVALTGTINDALDTVIGTSASTAQFVNKWSSRGIKRSLGVTRRDVEDGCKIELSLELDAVATISATDVVLLGLEMDYVPYQMVGQGSEVDAPILSSGV